MVAIDLKALTEEDIIQMGYNNHDLWLVKIGTVVFGPFESESLKHYVSDNEHLFENALASKAHETEWMPFWSYTTFQRRKLHVLSSEPHEGPFWLMEAGLKVGPFSFREIDKKIEMGLLMMTDHISLDEGHHWKKIYEIRQFDRRSHSADELPLPPVEATFHRAKLALMEKMDHPHVNTKDELAEMAWSGQQRTQVLQLKLDELAIKREKETEVSHSVKNYLPTAAITLLAIITFGYFMVSPEENVEVVSTPTEEPQAQKKAASLPARPAPRGVMPSVTPRAPASVGYSAPTPAPAYNNTSRYPTHIEMHEQHDQEAELERDPMDGPVVEAEQPQEHSLVGGMAPGPEDQPLDAAMNGVPQPVQPIIEEAADF